MVRLRELLGMLLTAVGLVLYIYAIVVGISSGSIGIKGRVELPALAMVFGMYAVLLGPALWLGDVPTAIKKFIEAKTGRKLS